MPRNLVTGGICSVEKFGISDIISVRTSGSVWSPDFPDSHVPAGCELRFSGVDQTVQARRQGIVDCVLGLFKLFLTVWMIKASID